MTTQQERGKEVPRFDGPLLELSRTTVEEVDDAGDPACLAHLVVGRHCHDGWWA